MAEQKASTMNQEILRECFETNFFGLVNVTNSFVPLLEKAQVPSILNVSTDMASIAGQVPENPHMPRCTAYNASKSAANAYGESLLKHSIHVFLSNCT